MSANVIQQFFRVADGRNSGNSSVGLVSRVDSAVASRYIRFRITCRCEISRSASVGSVNYTGYSWLRRQTRGVIIRELDNWGPLHNRGNHRISRVSSQ